MKFEGETKRGISEGLCLSDMSRESRLVDNQYAGNRSRSKLQEEAPYRSVELHGEFSDLEITITIMSFVSSRAS